MLGAGTIPNLDLGGSYIQLHTLIKKNHQAVCLRFMSFTTCKYTSIEMFFNAAE